MLFFVSVLWTLLTVRNPCRILIKNCVLILSRSLCVTSGVSVGFIVAKVLPLSTIGIIQEMSPVFALIMGALILQEVPRFGEMVLGALAVVGVTFVIQPRFIFKVDSLQNHFSSDQYPYIVASLLIPVGTGVDVVLVRKLSLQEIPLPLCMGSLSFVTFINGFILRVTYEHLSDAKIIHNLSEGFIILIVIIVLNFCNQVMMYFATKFEKSVIVLVMSSYKVVLLLLVDLFLFSKEMRSYNIFHFTGGALIMFSITSLVLHKSSIPCMKTKSSNDSL